MTLDLLKTAALELAQRFKSGGRRPMPPHNSQAFRPRPSGLIGMMFAWTGPPTDMSLTISPQWLRAKSTPTQPYERQDYEFTRKCLRFISRGQVRLDANHAPA